MNNRKKVFVSFSKFGISSQVNVKYTYFETLQRLLVVFQNKSHALSTQPCGLLRIQAIGLTSINLISLFVNVSEIFLGGGGREGVFLVLI